MIKAIIIDDEAKSISTLCKLLEVYCSSVEVVATGNSIVEARKLIDQHSPDLLFLDIEMPYGSGIDLLRSMEVIPFEVIFITAFDGYAIDAFRFAAIDYLLKPLNIEHLQDAVKRVEDKLSARTASDNYRVLLENMDTRSMGDQQIILTDQNGQHVFRLNEILYCRAGGSYTTVYLNGGRRFLSSRHLKEFETLLPQQLFFRIHHGHIVNIRHIRQVLKGRGGCLLMTDSSELEIAVRKKDAFLDWFRKNS